MQKITPFLWFSDNAEEAVNYYCSVFKEASIGNISRTGPGGPVLVISFSLNGQEFLALNGGPQFQFTEAVSFVIQCENQQDLDHYWDRLTDGGTPQQCGWLKDRFGLSWQVVPTVMGRLMSSKDSDRSMRVMQAMMQMQKIDIATLQAAYDGQTEAVQTA